ncbi:MAG: type II toxin-antitoxin system HicB family antitoxin [Lachnospiraceae bacterium]|jgi:predicted RNase H-like HicB family nuclease|nr:type II toxin-antitoxin system HicB family antitoxin [Lachnospiraceae bacterium]MDD3616983.1 type II toxin-antitoxin system HicB family antitoxin [Lachnospiraceae bacterium]
MKFIYPAVFHKNDEGTYEGYFPDLECCYAKGDTLDEAIDDANAAAYNWIEVELDDEEGELPRISDESDMDLKEGDIVRNICVTMRFHEGWDE